MNLFDVTKGCNTLAAKPRSATPDEVRAYLKWLAAERGIHLPHDAEYQDGGIWSRSAGEYVLEMPGYGQKQVATCDLLDDGGNVVRTMTLPQDRRGGIPATAKQVREWCGLKPGKAMKAKAIASIAEAAAEGAGAQHGAQPDDVAAKALEALQAAPEPISDAGELVTEADELPAPGCVKPSATDDGFALDDFAARLEALEAAVAALSAHKAMPGYATSYEAEKMGTPPIVAAAPARAPRTAAHERAIRRAWAERRAARLQRAIAADHMRMREQVQAECAKLANALAIAQQGEGEAMRHAQAFARRSVHHLERRRRAVLTARRHWKMRLVARGQYQAAERDADRERNMRQAVTATGRALVLKARHERDQAKVATAAAHADLAKVKRDMADPSQPERASDLARLLQERDQARTALAAVQARAERQQAALDQMAGQFDAMVSRVTRAEAAVRKLMAA